MSKQYKYMHTFQGKPATFNKVAEVVCMSKRINLVDSLYKLRKQQLLSYKHRLTYDEPDSLEDYGNVSVLCDTPGEG